jgi:EAL domain-containing protein (putative c-di-GMP-specific phosphodiesterase class I)/FixJ family two-component response regulator
MLLIDDEPLMLKLLAQMLARLGYRDVISCETGEYALTLLEQMDSRIDLLFLDVNMPGMDGVEFIRRLSETGFTGSVVLVSGETTRLLESVHRLILARGMHSLGSLQKPVTLERLHSLIQRLPAPLDSVVARVPRPAITLEQLQNGIANDELLNHYQPQVAFATGEVVGVETLVRWQPAVGPLIYPDQFLPLAEREGLIGVITRTVMVAAMKQARAWKLSGHDLNVAINVSMSDLTVLDFPDEAAAMAAYAGVDPRCVTLELTEGQVMRQLSTVLDVLARLQLKRFRLSIDDFGTGHSSLAQLRDLPFDELKIDRGFVHKATREPTLQAICSASLRMAQQLQMPAVAEGIETVEDWQLLHGLGCEFAQGYFIARPMAAESVLPWISEWHERHRELLRMQAG